MNEPRNDPHDKESGNSDHSRHHSCNVSIHQPAHLLSETVRPESHLKSLFLFSSSYELVKNTAVLQEQDSAAITC